ncbi:hypothetical protein ACW7G2_05170 [Luteimonas sp. A277]
MRHRLLLLLSATLLALMLGACAAPTTDAGAPANGAPEGVDPTPQAISGLPDLDYSCQVDSDCEVKNVGNCCGYFPACVNAAAEPDPDAVMAQCAESGMASVCGFREIQACTCVSNRCEAVNRFAVPLEQK